MREPPPHLTDEDVLAAVNENWAVDADRIGHVPVGFGAHHWRVSGAHTILFVTFDGLGGDRHTRESLEAAYAGARALADAGLPFVLAPIATTAGSTTVAFEDGALSVTPWRTGTSGDGSMTPARARETRSILDQLHRTHTAAELPRWKPLVAESLAEDLATTTTDKWDTGPHGPDARASIREHLDDIEGWTARYHRLAATTDETTWVPTHGEPHTRNQLTTPDATMLIDWESLKLAPRERDLRTLDDNGYPQADADDAMIELFDLEWRLDEISQYAAWFGAWHTGTASDAVAFAGLQGELTREGRHTRNATVPD